MTSRRSLLRGSAAILPLAMLAACGTGSTVATVTAQVLADATGIVNSTIAVATQVNTLSPGKIAASVVSALTVAQSLVGTLSTSTATAVGATTMQTVYNYVNDAVSAIAAVLPAAAVAFPALAGTVAIVDGVIALLPAIEAWISSVSSVATTKASAAAPHAPLQTSMSAGVARSVLHIPTVQ